MRVYEAATDVLVLDGLGPAVAQLPRPVAELVSAVARGIGLHPGQDAVSRKHFR